MVVQLFIHNYLSAGEINYFKVIVTESGIRWFVGQLVTDSNYLLKHGIHSLLGILKRTLYRFIC